MIAEEPLAARRRRLIRADLSRVALSLFAAHGFEAVTVDDIAAAANISSRTFFRYLATKDEVVLEFERRLFTRLAHAYDDRPAGEGPVTALRNAYLATSAVAPEERDRALELGRIVNAAPTLRATAHGERMAELEPLVERVAHRMGVDADDPRPRVVVLAMNAVVDAEWRAWVDDGGAGDPAERIGRALDLLDVGLAELDRVRRTPRRRRTA